MNPVPPNPRIYHITHVANLAAIVASGGLESDARMRLTGGPVADIGMSSIKARRLRSPVHCHPGDRVGDYVPFYFCPRSLMLFVIHRANHSELAYSGGQGPIVHLEADLRESIRWARSVGRRWAFTDRNASAAYAQFFARTRDLGQVSWSAVGSPNFGDAVVKEGKQAEFLLHGDFPWALVSRIGVHSDAVAASVHKAIGAATHKPTVAVMPGWYF